MPWLLALLLAASSAHRAKAERAEAFGRMADAAREYEAAYDDDKAPELLFRLGVVRRKLKQYAKAREAFRAYLRVAPDGGLQQEVERQMAKLEVLLEARTDEPYSEAPKESRAIPPAIVLNLPALPYPAPPLAVIAPVAPPPALPAPQIARREPSRSFGQKAAPYLAAGAVAALGAGGYLWWDGNRLSHALDTRYASGTLAASDQPLYGRAHSASLAGRALVAGGALLTAGAVVLWW